MQPPSSRAAVWPMSEFNLARQAHVYDNLNRSSLSGIRRTPSTTEKRRGLSGKGLSGAHSATKASSCWAGARYDAWKRPPGGKSPVPARDCYPSAKAGAGLLQRVDFTTWKNPQQKLEERS